jgi:putative tryptophan/tyrosine transport system substrate-binding protein
MAQHPMDLEPQRSRTAKLLAAGKRIVPRLRQAAHGRLTRRAAAVGLLLLSAPLAAEVQRGKVWRIGILEPYAASDPINEQIRQYLHEVGYSEGRNIAIEWRHGAGQTAAFPVLAAELARRKLDALVAIGEPAIRAAREATTRIPIIGGSDDLVGEGHVASLARPGGNVTGVSILASELNAKRLELLKQAVPTASRVAILWDPATGSFHLPLIHAVARTRSIELKVHEVRSGEDLKPAFEAARAWRADALSVLASPLLHALRQPIIDQAAQNRLPAIYQWEESVRAGGLMSYGPIRADVYRALCVQLDRVLRGAKPADLPVEQPTKFELVINLKTASALGLTIPQSLLVQADKVIE